MLCFIIALVYMYNILGFVIALSCTICFVPVVSESTINNKKSVRGREPTCAICLLTTQNMKTDAFPLEEEKN